MRRLHWLALTGASVFAASAGLPACGVSDGSVPGEQAVSGSKQALQGLQSAFPTARIESKQGRVTRVFGAPLSTGATAAEAAERFRLDHASAFGASAAELVPQELVNGRATNAATPKPLGVMFDRKTGQYKFWLFRYGQVRSGTPVFRSSLLTLVKNAANNPVVWASSTLHDLATFSAVAPIRTALPDAVKTLAAIRAGTDFNGRVLSAPTRVLGTGAPELTIFAGKEGADAPPRLAIDYVAQTDGGGKFRVVADAATGDVLHVESLIVFENVNGTVSGNVTQGHKAMDCADEAPSPFAYAEITGGSSSTFSAKTGDFVLTNPGTAALTLTSPTGGQYFDVVNAGGTTEQLTATVTPPGPASFLHNPGNPSDALRAQANGYANANEVRDFVLKYHPTYPTISTQLNFPVYVNRTDLYCPGNAWYDGASINFCVGSSEYGNTSFAGISQHEYGHHLVSTGGSDQGAYGEGMGDVVAALLAGDPGLGYGFYFGQCTSPLRNADNTCQYSATACSSCGSEVHACGNLLSGTIWSIRKALAISHPGTYVDTINSLALNSILLHSGSSIDSSIATDLITLDDDDGIIGNGSPHYAQICAGFSEHGMTCPPLLTGLSVTPSTTLNAQGPIGGPFAPESVSYTLANLNASSPLSYTVAPLAAAPWLTISNPSGTLAAGAQVQVNVAVNQATSAGLAKGKYNATLQFTNQSDNVGNATRIAQLEVGSPVPIYTENFEAGLGSFALGTETTNRWHLSSACASTQSGHSLPNSLYFGSDSQCNFDLGTSAGTATSIPVAVADTSVVRLKFKYFLHTERLSPYDKATAEISVNGGPFSIVASNNAGGQPLLDASGNWEEAVIDVSSVFAGTTTASASIRFGFSTGDGVLNAFPGFLVDDVQLLAFAGACTSNAQCDDGLFCNGTETCSNGTCAAGIPVVCADSISCTTDSCNEATDTCVFAPNDNACSDSNACNGTETCSASAGCQAGTPLNCNDGTACTTDSCNPTSGCQNTPIDCSDSNECTVDSCDAATGCSHSNSTGACTDDGNSCTSDVCSAGVCTHPDNGSCNSPPFVESNGQVVIEAEHFSTNTARASHTWDLTSNSSASGGQWMQSNPNNGANINTGYVTGSPQLNFPVKFTTTGTYQVWIRGTGPGTADRTVHAGIDDTGPASADRISGFSTNLAWSKSTLDGAAATINVTTAGVHTIQVWMREDGFRFDKLLLTTSTSFTPSGAGPAESPKATPCSSAATCDDSNPCTTDSCTSGFCSNTAAANGTSCPDDGNSCTSDVCTNGTCTHPSNGSCQTNPCASYCQNPVNFSGNFQSGNLGTAATCHQTTNLNGGNCGNFVNPRALFVNGVQMTCNNNNWSNLPPKVNGGYCVQTTAGNHPWAYFATW